MEQANRAVEGMTRTIMSCLETRYEVEIPPSCAMGDPTRGLAVGTFPTRRGWPERVQSTVPEELPKCDFAVCRDRALARSRTSHVETSIQVGMWSMVVRSVASDSHVIGTLIGCFLVRRMRPSARNQVQVLLSMRGTPARLAHSGPTEPRGVVEPRRHL